MPIVLERVHLMLRTSMKVFIGSVQVHLERLNKLLIVCLAFVTFRGLALYRGKIV